jgi:ATP-binding cassette, subfamily C, bacterial
MQALAGASWDRVAPLRHARVTHLMSGDIQNIGTATFFLTQSLVAIAMLLAQCVLAFYLAPLLALLAFGLLVVSGIAMVPMLYRARGFGTFVTNANLSLLNSTAQFLGGLKLAVSQNLQKSYVSEFRTVLKFLSRKQIDYQRQNTNCRLALTTLSALVGAALVLIGFGTFHIAPAVLVALLLVVSRMSGPASQIQQGAQQLANALPAYGKIKELEAALKTGTHTNETAASASLPSNGRIVFENVVFCHRTEGGEARTHGVFGLCLAIENGEFLGIRGASGAGKTTFADLLVGLYAPQSGSITVGGRTLSRDVLSSWREQISYVSQDPFLFYDSIRRNLAWAKPSATEQEMWEALRFADADDLVRKMAQGLDTVVGERGSLMSGGERQRIALARAILRRPQLLVLDEATNAIDIDTERRIVERLVALAPRPTIVMIAHRDESIARCDRVLTVANGVNTGPL